MKSKFIVISSLNDMAHVVNNNTKVLYNCVKKNKKSIHFLSHFSLIFYIFYKIKISDLEKRISRIENLNKSGIENA